jgi:ASC-1-like (ASCH) protein
MTIHDVKIEELYFDDVASGKKKAEIRHNDRNYKVLDTLMMREWNPLIDSYTERVLFAQITHVYQGPNIPNDYAILSIRVMK